MWFFCGGLWCWSVMSHLYRVNPPKAPNTPLSFQLCTHTHTQKHTHSQTLYKPSRNCCSVPTYCGGYRPENKFGKLEVCQRAVSHRCMKALADSQRFLPSPAEPDWPALAPQLHLTHQRNADAAISGSTITVDPCCLFAESSMSFFLHPPCKVKLILSLAGC